MSVSIDNHDASLPKLRDDLHFERGAPHRNGEQRWIIYDPANHRYYEVSDKTLEILSLWSIGTVEGLKRIVEEKFGTALRGEDISRLVSFLSRNELLELPCGDWLEALSTKAAARKTSLSGWMTHRYLFFRIPLINPDAVLQKVLPLARLLFSAPFVMILFAGMITGLWMLSLRWTEFIGTLDRVSASQAFWNVAAALILSKSVHELGHAFQAKLRGVRVTSMGVAFMVFLPMLYTDVSDVWRLRGRSDRLWVDAGGVTAELALAVVALLLWLFLPEGASRDMAFFIASVSWILSLLFNLNPLMKFDGYFLLVDLVSVPNLMSRSIELLRGLLRRDLLGIPNVEIEHLNRRLARFMLLYGCGVLTYRLFLFIGISFVVYTFFFKALGIFLFLCAFFFLLLQPVFGELRFWWRSRNFVVRSRRAWISSSLLGAAIVSLFLPISLPIAAPALSIPGLQTPVFPPAPGLLGEILVEQGASVQSGDLIARMEDLDLEFEESRIKQELQLVDIRLGRRLSLASDKRLSVSLENERRLLLERLASIERSRAMLEVRAPSSGVIAEVNSHLHSGIWIDANTRLVLLVKPGEAQFQGYLREIDRLRIDLGTKGEFIPNDPFSVRHLVQLVGFDKASLAHLDLPELSTENGGPIRVNLLSNESQIPVGSWYGFDATPLDEIAGIAPAQAGIVRFWGHPESVASRVFRQVAKTLIREAGL